MGDAADVSLSAAVAGEGADAPVAAHYGEPYAEQRRLETGGLVDRSHRGVVAVSGPDRLSWLHALTTQDMLALPPHSVTRTLVLSPQGHVEHEATVVDDGDTTWLLVEPGAAPPLVAFLDSMRFLTRVEVRDESAALATLTVTGPVPAGVAAGAVVSLADVRATDLLVPRDEVAPLLLAHQDLLAGHDAWEALRVAAGEPRFGLDTDHRTLVHEVGWLAPAVALDKGCYRGQETVARVHNLGRPPRRLVLVHLDGSDHLLPESGADVVVGGRTVGSLRSRARHHELGPVGLALLKRSVPDDAPLLIGGSVAGALERDLSSPTEPVDLGGIR